MDTEKLWRGLKNGFAGSLNTPTRIASTLVFASLIFLLMVLASQPNYSIQVLGFGLEYLPDALKTLFLYNTTDFINRILTVAYAATAGVALTGLAVQLKLYSIDLKSVGSLAPGFLATGCVSCGAGLLGFLGLSGGLVLFPFGGNGVLFGGIALMAFFIAKNGDPETCAIDAS